LAKALSYVCKSRHIKFLVAGDVTLALMVEADGVHLPEYMMENISDVRKEHPDFIITVAAHSEEAVVRAMHQNVYAVMLAPIFPTKSHPETFDDPSSVIGVHGLAEICKRSDVAIYALAGINTKTASKILRSGVAGFAATRGV
ncbi:MAG: thiamine phosphate synthase, partial [Emcibacteraceae bacterium]|nr:thiamine phosphate synthase [Emcibacteraceae bacterium]